MRASDKLTGDFMGRFTTTAALVALCAASMLRAEDTTTDPELAAIAKRQALATAQKAEYDADASKYTAQKAAADAKFSFVPQSGAEGKVTLGDGAGSIETNMLVSSAIGVAARLIVADVQAPSGTLLLAGDEAVTVDGFATFKAQVFGVDAALRGVMKPIPSTDSCEPPKAPPPPGFAPMVIGAAISAIAGAIRTDTEVRGFTSDLGSAVLVRAVAAKAPGQFVLPSQVISPDIKSDNLVVVSICKLQILRDAANAQIPAKPADDQKDHAAALAAAVGRYDTFLAGLTKPDDKGSIPLATAYKQSVLIPNGRNLLRVYVDKAGGSLLTRRNLWTALGANAVGVSGGLLVSYTMTDPMTGMILKADMLRCGTGLAGLREVRGDKDKPASCRPE